MFGNGSTWRPESASLGEPESLAENWNATWEATKRVELGSSRLVVTEEAYQKRIDAIEQATGVRLVHPMHVPAISSRFGGTSGGRAPTDFHAKFMADVAKLAEQHPDKRDVLRPDVDPRRDAEGTANAAERRADLVAARTPGFVPGLVRFGAGLAAGMTDVENLATLFVGPLGTTGTGARAVIWTGIKSGAANAGVEASQQPFVQAWRRDAGLEHGLSHAAMNVAVAGALGFGLDAGVRGAYRGIQSRRGQEPILNEAGGVIGYRPRDVSENIRAQNPEDALDALARSKGPTATLRKAADGDPDALTRAVAQMPEVKADPAVRGAVKELQLEAEIGPVKVPDADDADHMLAVVQALRHATDDGEPPAGPITRLAPETGPRLSDDSPSPAPVGRSYRLDDKPVHAQMARPRDVVADPGQFQFRGGADAVGDTGRLAGITKWDDLAAGRVLLFERADGTRVVADGHHRLALAKRLEAEGQKGLELEAHVFREADGWTAGDVRALAAKKNLQEGRADAVDAARVLRERPDILDASVGLGSEAMRQARSLARLSDPAFNMVVSGRVAPNHAAEVGRLVADPRRHVEAVEALIKADPANVREARHIVADIARAPSHITAANRTIMGLDSRGYLLPERAKVLDQAVKLIREDARIFGLVSKEASRLSRVGNELAVDANAARALDGEMAAALIEDLASRPGPLSDWLSAAAASVQMGTKPKVAAKEFAERVRIELEESGLRALEPRPEPRVQGLVEPRGAEAEAQVAQLEAELSQAVQKAAVKGAAKNIDRYLSWQKANGRDAPELNPAQREAAVKSIVGGMSVADAIEKAAAEARQRPKPERLAPDGETRHAVTPQQAIGRLDRTLAAGEPAKVDGGVVRAAHKALAPYLDMVPEGLRIGVLADVTPLGDGRVRAAFLDQNGKRFTLDGEWSRLRGLRATFHPAGAVLLFRHALSERFVDSIRGELWHELVHLKVAKMLIGGDDFALLVRHAEALRVLDMDAAAFMNLVGRDEAFKSRPLRTIYERQYSTRANRDALMQEEAVAHMVELAYHGQLTPVEIAPVRHVLARVFDGEMPHMAAKLEAAAAQPMFAFGGVRAVGADLTALEAAQRLERLGTSEREIWMETGWYRGVDGHWRFEIDDADARLSMRAEKTMKGQFESRLAEGPAPEVLTHDALYKAYPQLRGVQATMRYVKGEKSGAADPLHWQIEVTAASARQGRLIGLHEMQHLVQQLEGFAEGGSPVVVQALLRKAMADLDAEAAQLLERLAIVKGGEGALARMVGGSREATALGETLARLKTERDRLDHMNIVAYYRQLAGEVEARNVADRADMTAAERRAIPPWDTADTPAGQQIVAHGLGGRKFAKGTFDEGLHVFEERRDTRMLRPRGQPKPNVEREAELLLDAVRQREKALLDEGMTAHQIADELTRHFGIPFDADAIARGAVWWRVEQTVPEVGNAAQSRSAPASARSVGFQLSESERATALELAKARVSVADIVRELQQASGHYISPSAVAQWIERSMTKVKPAPKPVRERPSVRRPDYKGLTEQGPQGWWLNAGKFDWGDDQVSALRNLNHLTAASAAEVLAEKFNSVVSAEAVRQKRSELKLRVDAAAANKARGQRSNTFAWPMEAETMLRKLDAEHMTMQQIADRLNVEFGTALSSIAVQRRRAKLRSLDEELAASGRVGELGEAVEACKR